VDVVAVLNDTTGTLLAGSYLDKHCGIGLIMGIMSTTVLVLMITDYCLISSYYWHCPHNAQSRVCDTVQCLSVHLSVPSWAHSSNLVAAGLLLWAQSAGDIDRLP